MDILVFSYFSRTGNVSPLLLSKYLIMTLDGFNDALTFCVTPSGGFFLLLLFSHILCKVLCKQPSWTQYTSLSCTLYKV